MATAANGIGKSENLSVAMICRNFLSTFRPAINAFMVGRSKTNSGNFFQLDILHHVIASSTRPAAMVAPAIAPIEVPAMQ